MYGRILVACLALIVGCTEPPDVPGPGSTTKPTSLSQAFDETTTGTIAGRVTWEGDAPTSKEFVVRSIANNPSLFQKPARFTTPRVPRIDPKSSGVGGVIVFLKAVDPRKARPWDHAKVSVEFQNRQILVSQGDVQSHVGFVRVGGVIDIGNCDAEYHVLRARGAAFFATPLVGTNMPHERVLSSPGIVDFTCGAGYFWLSAHLFVVEHPYYTRTDSDGRFTLDRVPSGEYEVVCWMPNWRVDRAERDAETADVVRWFWAPPNEQARSVRVESAKTSEVAFRWNAQVFGVE
jgi:hypothetical protein